MTSKTGLFGFHGYRIEFEWLVNVWQVHDQYRYNAVYSEAYKQYVNISCDAELSIMHNRVIGGRTFHLTLRPMLSESAAPVPHKASWCQQHQCIHMHYRTDNSYTQKCVYVCVCPLIQHVSDIRLMPRYRQCKPVTSVQRSVYALHKLLLALAGNFIFHTVSIRAQGHTL